MYAEVDLTFGAPYGEVKSWFLPYFSLSEFW